MFPRKVGRKKWKQLLSEKTQLLKICMKKSQNDKISYGLSRSVRLSVVLKTNEVHLRFVYTMNNVVATFT